MLKNVYPILSDKMSMPRKTEKKTEMRVYLTDRKHADIIAWMQRQGNISEAVIALIRRELTLTDNDTLQEIKQLLHTIAQHVQPGYFQTTHISEHQEKPDSETDPELMNALNALG